MQPVTIADHPADAAGLLAEIAALSVLGIKGEVAVELLDERGRVTHRIEAPNYVNTTQWANFAKAIQKLAWTYGYAGDTTTVTNRATDGRDPRTIPTIRNDVIACWTDTTAEDSTDTHPMGEVTAWAHRFSQGSPSTRQGLVQPSLCTLSDTAVKWVWEWTTGAGNGTYQSVGWRRLGQSQETGDAVLFDLPQMSRRQTTAGTNTVGAGFQSTESWTAGAGGNIGGGPYYNSADGKMYGVIYSAAGTYKLWSAVVTIDSAGNYSTGNITDESANTLADGLRGNDIYPSTATAKGLTRLGASGDWIEVGYTSSNTARRPEIRRVTTAGAVTYTNANAGTYAVESGFQDVTYDGTDLWVVARNGNTGAYAIHRIAAATGTISATLTVSGLPAYFPSLTALTRSFVGIEWDAARSCLWIATSDGYLFNVDTSGVWLGVLLAAFNSQYPLAPDVLTGQHRNERMDTLGFLDVDPIFAIFAGGSGIVSTNQTWPGNQSALQAAPSNTFGISMTCRLFTMAGSIWTYVDPGNMSSRNLCVSNAFEELPCFSTRSLLGASVTKNSSQTMRIAYTMTFT